jgi:hypothetical protein
MIEWQIASVLPALAKQLFAQDPEVLADSIWAIAHLCEGTNDRIEVVVQAGVTR